jgi:4-amino-4-deoxy-L-arabinose transferase-like glycosyltransferase
MSRQLLLVLAVVFLIRLPFLNQAIQGDDPNYLSGAEHAQIDPLHPTHARYLFMGQEVSMQGHSHPPFNLWFLGAVLALVGDIREIPFHAAYILFSLVAALAMWSLAKRFTTRPLLATLLFLAAPAFVVNGNSFEADVPFLALWIASIALFVSAVDARSVGRLAWAGLAMALAALAAYQAMLIVPILAIYLWTKRRDWLPAWAALLAPPASLGLWQLFERLSSGSAPAAVLAGYFQSYGFQRLSAKAVSAAALTGHTAWLICPVLLVLAFKPARRWLWLVAAALAAAAAFLDWNPLFWASVGISALLFMWCGARIRKPQDADTRFLALWVLIFFAGALAIFFAGSARYLLPMVAPVALLATRVLAGRPWWLAAGVAAQMALSLGLSFVNYQHWDGYRQFAASLRSESAARRVWINSELGLRYYLESDGALGLRQGQAVRPGDMVVTSQLAFPIPFATGGGALVPVADREIHAWLPLRLIGLGSKSGYSDAGSFGFRPFDVSGGPIDRVRAEVVVERKPTLSYLEMNAPEASQHIISGLYDLEQGRWRWMSAKAILLLKPPAAPRPVVEVVFSIPDQSPARRVTLSVDDVPVIEKTFEAPGAYTLTSGPVTIRSDSPTLTIAVDKVFSVQGDRRELGIVLLGAGFKPSPVF